MNTPRFDPRPVSTRISADLLQRIRAEEFPPGSKLPSTNALATKWQCSPNTVRQAFENLRRDGLVISYQGRGVFVRENPPIAIYDSDHVQEEKDLVHADEETRRGQGAAEMALGRPIDDLNFKPTFEHVLADLQLAETFGVPEDTALLRRTYETADPDTGLRQQWSRSWLVIDHIAGNPDLLRREAEPWPGGTQHQLSTVGIEVDRVDFTVGAVAATVEDRTAWGIPEATPLLSQISTMIDTTGRVVCVSEALYPADRASLRFHIQLARW